jgi:iron(III) transport system permease protein
LVRLIFSRRGAAASNATARPRSDPLGKGVSLLAILGLLLCAVPVTALLQSALSADSNGAFGIENFRDILQSPELGTVALNTVLLTLGSVLVMLVCVIPLAWLYTRTAFRWRPAILFLATAQLAMPGFLVALGYIFLLNPQNGIVNEAWTWLTGSQRPLTDVYSMPWMILLQGLSLVGPAFYFIAPIFATVDTSLEESALAHGISEVRTLTGVLLPLLKWEILSVSIFFLLLSVETFDFAGMLGMPVRIDVLASWVYGFTTSAVGEQYGHASAVGVLVAVPLMGLMFASGAAASRRRRVEKAARSSRQHAVRLSASVNGISTLGVLVFALLAFFLPIAMLVWCSLLPYPATPSMRALEMVSLAGYGAQFRADLLGSGASTLLLVLLVPTCAVAAIATVDWLARQGSQQWRGFVLAFVFGSLPIPSVVLAAALAGLALACYRVLPVYGTFSFLAACLVIRYLGTSHKILSTTSDRMPPELFEAAAIEAIKPGRAFLNIYLPVLSRALLFTWLWVALLVLRELPITLVLGSVEMQTLSTKIFFYNSGGQSREAAALSVAQLLAIGVVLFAFLKLRPTRADEPGTETLPHHSRAIR